MVWKANKEELEVTSELENCHTLTLRLGYLLSDMDSVSWTLNIPLWLLLLLAGLCDCEIQLELN